MDNGISQNNALLGNDVDSYYNDKYFVSWFDVGVSWLFIFISVVVSFGMGTGLELSIIIASLRCLVQLTLMGYVLDGVIQSKSFILVMSMTLMLVFTGAYELSFIRAKKTIRHFFFTIFVILLVSNVTIAVLGSLYALEERPFWTPSQFIPILGILLGKSMSNIAMATHQCLDSINIYGPVMETRLALGASRYEAIQPFATEVIRLSMLPIIVQLSVMGMINIPGTMAGQLMAGMSIQNAVIYQQCIMFMITASSVLGVVMAVVVCMITIINNKHVICWNKVLDRKPLLQLKHIRNYLNFFIKCVSIIRRHHCRVTGELSRQPDNADISNNKDKNNVKKKYEYEYEQMEMQLADIDILPKNNCYSCNQHHSVLSTRVPSSSSKSHDSISSKSDQ